MRGFVSALSFAVCLAAPAWAFAQEAAPAPAAAEDTTQPSAQVETQDAVVSDPWEHFNRSLYSVHDGVDRAVLEPVARGYRAVTPGFFREGVRNFLHNLRSPVIFANDVLQGQFRRAGITAARFGINTTLGIVGVLDPASGMGLESHDEDFGQTLAVWGLDAGPYIFIPVIGPTTVRDGIGSLVDLAFDPLKDDPGTRIFDWNGGRGADVSIECAASNAALQQATRAVGDQPVLINFVSICAHLVEE